MKIILIFIAVCLLFIESSSASYAEQDILWEKAYSGDLLANALARSITRIDDKLVLVYGGYPHDVFSYHTGIVITDLSGNLLSRNELLDIPEQLIHKVLKKEDSYYYYIYYRHQAKFKLSLFKTDETGKIIREYKDTLTPQNYYSSSFIIESDSIYSSFPLLTPAVLSNSLLLSKTSKGCCTEELVQPERYMINMTNKIFIYFRFGKLNIKIIQ